ncbi:hypothetical protein EON82_11455 [bacterium]|nr:MAG: hypothetical protein EON82_11455 [bacterium]
MRLLTVPNWSFGRSPRLLRCFADVLSQAAVDVHYLRGDIDHNRTVSAFSGEPEALAAALLGLADYAMDAIDLSRHVGVHPRIGALDVLPFVPFGPEDLQAALAFAESFAKTLAERYEIPVFLYERSERGRHEADLPSLRHGGFGSLLERNLNPDFGPSRAHPQLGATIMGVRDPLIALNVDLRHPVATVARTIAAEIRDRRTEGDPTFLGVRALGMTLPSREMSQVSLNVTLPDLTPLDPIVEWIEDRALTLGVASAGAELVGVICARHLEHATRVPFDPAQVV